MSAVSKLMLGGNIFGYFTDRAQTAELICRAKELGICAIDTADVYSNGVSEQYIGDAIRNDRASWFIATKAGLASHASPRGLGKKELLIKKAEESLRRLQTDYIDLYQIHHFDEETPLDETLEAFAELKKRGWIRSGGVSNYSVEQLEKLGRQTHPMKYHQTPFNITLSRQMKTNVSVHQASSLGILAYSVLARGLLHEKYLQGNIPSGSRASISNSVRGDLSEEFLEKLRRSSELSLANGHSLLSLGLQWVCQFDIVKQAIVGVRNMEQLDSLHRAALASVSGECLKQFETIWE